VYIPLGGNRCAVPRQVLNLFVVWFLTGLWHGASWNFVLWGLYFGLLIGLERFVLKDKLDRIPLPLKGVGVFLLVLFSWILFKFTDFELLGIAVKGLFGLNGNGFTGAAVGLAFKNNLFFLVFSTIACFPVGKMVRNILGNLSKQNTAFFGVNAVWEAAHPMILLLLSAMALAGDSYNPFLYFQF
jgi:alginate O-acetyltransferase complex protein AlgI